MYKSKFERLEVQTDSQKSDSWIIDNQVVFVENKIGSI